MEQYILRDQGIALTLDEVYKVLHLTEDMDEEDAKTVSDMVAGVNAVANPKAVYCVAAIEEKGPDYVVIEGHKFVSQLVRDNLEPVHKVIPYAVTCGEEAEAWSKQFDDILLQFWADEIKKLLMGKINQMVVERIRKTYFPEGGMSAMSPGSLAAWPLTEQRTLFGLIGDVKELVGITLTESCLMLPSKSISGFYFSSDTGYVNCKYCPILKCPGRRAPFEGEL